MSNNPEIVTQGTVTLYSPAGVHTFVEKIKKQLPSFDFSSTDYSGEYRLRIYPDVTLMGIDVLGKYASEVATYCFYLSEQLSDAEAEFWTIQDLVKKYQAVRAKEVVEQGLTAKTNAKDYIQSDKTLIELREMELEAKIKYANLERKVKNLQALSAHLSREQTRKGMPI